MEIRRSYDRLISIMGFPILVRRHLYIESGIRSSSSLEVPPVDTTINQGLNKLPAICRRHFQKHFSHEFSSNFTWVFILLKVIERYISTVQDEGLASGWLQAIRWARDKMSNGAGWSYSHISPSFDLMVALESPDYTPYYHDALY